RTRAHTTGRLTRLGGALACVVIALSLFGGCSKDKTTAAKATDALGAGLVAHKKGDLTKAAVQYNKTLKLDRNNKWAIYNLGLIDQTAGRNRDAEEKYRRVITLDIAFTPALFNLAILRTPDAPQEAAQLYREVIR